MKLISLDLKNFRQHLDSSITFTDGLTGVIGANGAGKTTILEAIAWALYGSPALRGNNDTVRANAAEGGAKAGATLAFELGGSIYKASRSLDGSGRSGSAVLEVDGRALRSGMTEVTAAMTRLIGMDYQAFFTSFFTGQKQLEFMSQLDGRARAVAISRMLGYDRVSKARDQANEDRKGLQREIEGLERGLPDLEELKQRKKEAEADLTRATSALDDAEKLHKRLLESLEKIKPLKEASDQKAKRQEELSRRLESDRAEVGRTQTRLKDLKTELSELEGKRKEFESLKSRLGNFREAAEEYKKLAELSKYEGERQRVGGQASTVEQDIARLRAREKKLAGAQESQLRAASALSEAENQLAGIDRKIQALREEKVARLHTIEARLRHFESTAEEIAGKRARIAEAGAEGKCPTCERPLAEELHKVLASFDAQTQDLQSRIKDLKQEKQECEPDGAEAQTAAANRQQVAAEIDKMRAEKSKADLLVQDLQQVGKDTAERTATLDDLRRQLDKLPAGFDQARFHELEQVRESLQPVRERAAALKAELDRAPKLQTEESELGSQLEAKNVEIADAERALEELAFSPEQHERLTAEFESASTDLTAAGLQLERQRGEVNTARVVLQQVEREEQSYKQRLEELKGKRSERLSLQTLAAALDRLRADLNDRIRPELEATASELLAMMTDGRYNVLEINDHYQAVIRDDGELKPVISGGEDDIVNLALRLAISQMIADRAGQSFSLLVLDEVFGSLDDVRRENVVSLLQNLKNRFEQIILITHVESIHDAVDNCLWVEFDERRKTSRLTDKSAEFDQSGTGVLV